MSSSNKTYTYTFTVEKDTEVREIVSPWEFETDQHRYEYAKTVIDIDLEPSGLDGRDEENDILFSIATFKKFKFQNSVEYLNLARKLHAYFHNFMDKKREIYNRDSRYKNIEDDFDLDTALNEKVRKELEKESKFQHTLSRWRSLANKAADSKTQNTGSSNSATDQKVQMVSAEDARNLVESRSTLSSKGSTQPNNALGPVVKQDNHSGPRMNMSAKSTEST